MPQNRNSMSSKVEKTKSTYISSLKDDLMFKINQTHEAKPNFRPVTSQKSSKYPFSSLQEDLEVISFENSQAKTFTQRPKTILQKAKQITRINKQQIESAKKAYKKSNLETDGMFLTGCGLYRAEEQSANINQDFDSVDLNDALKFLVSHQKDDLQELRRMIQKTNSNIKEYSQEVSRTTGQVQNAADLFGRDFNIDLKVKINRCKPIESQFQSFNEQQNASKRKISTSGSRRNKNFS